MSSSGSVRGGARGARLPPAVVPWLVGALFSAGCLAYETLRWSTLRSQAFDLAFFDQIVWNLSRGNGWVSSFIPYSFLGQHFSPALALFVPLYLLRPSPLWLLLGQALALGAAVVPLQALARAHLGPSRAWALVIAYLFNVGISRALGYDFHTECLAVPFTFAALLAAGRRRWPWFWICALVPVLAKEDGTLVAFGIGTLTFLRFDRRAGLLLMGVATGLALVLVFAVMPLLRDLQPLDLAARYSYLTMGWAPAWAGTVNRISDPAAAVAVATLLCAVGFLPFLRPSTLLGVLPATLLALLSMDRYQHQLLLQYSVQVVPLLLAAAILGWRELDRRWPAFEKAPLPALLVGAAAMQVIFAPLAGPLGAGTGRFLDFTRASQVAAAVSHVPSAAPVAAASDVLPRLAERRVIAQLPGGEGLPWMITETDGPLPSGRACTGCHIVAIEGRFVVWHREI